MTVRPADPADLQFAIDIARRAGAITLDLFRSTTLRVDHKGDGSPVTAADLAAETFLRQQLIDTHPGDGIVGEEHGNKDATTGRTWVVDPIDGTKAFTRGVPLFATLIALIDEHGPAIGVIHLPGLDETVAAGRGLGATVNGEPCRVSNHVGVEGAYIMTSGFSYWPDEALASIMASPAVLRTWGDAYGYTLVATGRAEAMIDPMANPWDVAPMAVIIPEAGGTFSGFDGSTGPDAWRCGSGMATHGSLQPDLLELWGAD